MNDIQLAGGMDSHPDGRRRPGRRRANQNMIAAIVAAAAAIAIVAVTTIRFMASEASGVMQATSEAAESAGLGKAPRTQEAGDSGARASDAGWHSSLDRDRLQAESDARAQHDEFATRYREEDVDARWAARKETVLLNASTSSQIAELGAAPKHLDIDCKSSICRVQADFAVQSSAQDWVTLFLLNAGSQMPRSVFGHSVNPDRTIRVEILGYSRSPVPDQTGVR
jgi:hypothetical protein